MGTKRIDPSEPSAPGGLTQLLEPSLRSDPGEGVPYSVRATFMVAFFGGVYAILWFSWLNSRRLGRAKEDAWLYAHVALVWTVAMGWWVHAILDGSLPAWLGRDDDSQRSVRLVSRGIALAVFGVIHLRLRRFFKAAELSGQEAPSPWQAGLTAVALGTVVTMAVGGAVGILRS